PAVPEAQALTPDPKSRPLVSAMDQKTLKDMVNEIQVLVNQVLQPPSTMQHQEESGQENTDWSQF
ncbi:hypothetical protein HF673_13220, partial [Acidithiobacillus thiooxidans]